MDAEKKSAFGYLKAFKFMGRVTLVGWRTVQVGRAGHTNRGWPCLAEDQAERTAHDKSSGV